MKEYTQLQYALSYSRLGFSVFPLKPRSKIPFTKNGYKDATKDEKQINDWWSQYPDANIGIATGKVSDNLFVIDFNVDDNGVNGYYTFLDYCKNEKISFPDTVKVTTGRSGIHWYYKAKKGIIINSKQGIIDGVDLRGDNGYVVAPGSTHANGNKYTFIQDFNDIQIADANNIVYDFINQKNKNELEKKESKQYITLKTKENKNGDSVLIQSIENCCTVLALDKNLSGKIKYNELSYSPFVYGNLPWTGKDNYREWNNFDDSNLKCYIEGNYGLNGMEKIMEALNIIVSENKFNPVIDYLEQIQWDGKERIKTLLSDYLGVEQSEYSETAIKLFMIGAINRVYYPGCKFDYMPVLVGKQGVGKSTFFKILAGNDAWYNDNFNTVEGDKAVEKLRGMWLVELAELLAAKKAQEVESIKSFLTSTVDNYRQPYSRRTEQRPRYCVFAGTTNNLHFMTDKTGNRRYWPLIVRKEYIKKSLFTNKEEVREEFRQAWGKRYIFLKQKILHWFFLSI